jgi:hypothetical protein
VLQPSKGGGIRLSGARVGRLHVFRARAGKGAGEQQRQWGASTPRHSRGYAAIIVLHTAHSSPEQFGEAL